ncbi:hypothetical protein B296_00012754 [Ensete ventricosum]|uniref:Uncharacterized protein n=1 Tax=Ensete ventricosum TaxID=4639 RepID=A0A426ZBM1_ENSVE|nr:hypothetical protein B296_00012754 [Ensete ventricosum]
MAVEGQRGTKNVALIPIIITLTDSKLGVISIGDRPPWNSIGAQRNKETTFLRPKFRAGGAGDEGGLDLSQETFF